MARVTMKGGMRNRVIMAPENAPATPHTRMAATQDRTMPVADAPTPPARSRMNRADRTADNASRLPTDKSMPPVTMTIVMPMAMMAMTAIWLAMLSRFSDFRKFGQR